MKRAALFSSLAIATSLSAMAGHARADEFKYMPAGDLVSGSGKGRADDKVYAPGMLFPIEGAAYANSQVWGNGGSQGPGGSQCDKANFSYPWRDNYCETRSWDMPLCPAGVGHQGQDIRAADCTKDKHWAVAATDGTITHIGSYTVYLTAADGTRFDYLHMSNVQVTVGKKVKRGDHLGKVSNQFDGTPTTTHLHFNIKQNVNKVGIVFVPPYMSLVTAYQATMDSPPQGKLETANCDRIRGWAFDADQPKTALSVAIGVDGANAGADQTLAASDERQDLCESLGSCAHGFEASAPLSLFDGKKHDLAFSAIDPKDSKKYPLAGSPKSISCDAIAPTGVRRPIDAATMKAWRLTAFWDQLPQSSDAALLPLGGVVPSKRKVVIDPDDADVLWIIDGAAKRKLAASAADGWHIEKADLEAAGPEHASLPVGAPMPARVTLVDVGGATFLLDAGENKSAPPSVGGAPETAPQDSVDSSSSCSVAGIRARGAKERGAIGHAASARGWLLLALVGAMLARRRRLG